MAAQPTTFSTVYDTIPSGKQLKSFTREEVARHDKEGDLWCIVDTAVYDLSKFVDLHPGGAAVLLDKKVAGKDATQAFFGLHRSDVLKKYGRYVIGRIDTQKIITQENKAVMAAQPTTFSTVYDTIPSGKQLKSFTREEVARHDKEGDLWCIVDTAVYDLSKFVDLHPGGAAVLLDKKVAGKDATQAFFGLHRSDVLKKYGRYVIGRIDTQKS